MGTQLQFFARLWGWWHQQQRKTPVGSGDLLFLLDVTMCFFCDFTPFHPKILPCAPCVLAVLFRLLRLRVNWIQEVDVAEIKTLFFSLPGLVFRWISSSVSSKIQMHRCLCQREKRDPIGTEGTGLFLSLRASSVGWALASSPHLENGAINNSSLIYSLLYENLSVHHIRLHLSIEQDHRVGIKSMETAHSLGG